MFSPGIERALRAADVAHRGQLRKGAGEVPYVLHPIHAALILARLGADEESLQAAILHDVVEDCDGWTLERVAFEFSERVARIVEDLTEDKSRSWEERKRAAVRHVADMLPEAAAIKAADALHNLSTLLADLETTADRGALWAAFRGGRERTLAHAEDLVLALEPRVDPRLGRALRETLASLRAIGA